MLLENFHSHINLLGKLDATPLLEYYEPLINWLSGTNEKDEVFFGWDGAGEKFKEEELPNARVESGNKPSIPSDDQIAYPGTLVSYVQFILLVCRIKLQSWTRVSVGFDM
jgi:hypothetical protein